MPVYEFPFPNSHVGIPIEVLFIVTFTDDPHVNVFGLIEKLEWIWEGCDHIIDIFAVQHVIF